MAEPGTRWTASSPVHTPAPEPRPRVRYAGPPAYPTVPQWGLPRVLRRPSQRLGTPGPGNTARMQALAASAVPTLWLVAATALVAAGAEVWRYTLLLASRSGAVAADPLRASDALAILTGVLAVLLAALAMLLGVFWLVRAYAAAAEQAGVAQPRPVWHLVVGVLLPGPNLVVAGAVLAEIEHTAHGRSPRERPRPSRLVLAWWVAWVASVLAAGTTFVWSFRDTVQAQADGVLLHAGTNLLAAAVAALSAVLLRRITRLLLPARPRRAARMVVTGVTGRTG